MRYPHNLIIKSVLFCCILPPFFYKSYLVYPMADVSNFGKVYRKNGTIYNTKFFPLKSIIEYLLILHTVGSILLFYLSIKVVKFEHVRFRTNLIRHVNKRRLSMFVSKKRNLMNFLHVTMWY